MDLAEGGSLGPLLLPTVQHQLVEVGWTVHRGGQAEAILYRFDHLGRDGEEMAGEKGVLTLQGEMLIVSDDTISV